MSDPAHLTKIAVFKGKQVRKTIHHNEWWFSINDVVEALTGTERPRKYWNDLKKKLIQEGYVEVSEKIGQLKITACGSGKVLNYRRATTPQCINGRYLLPRQIPRLLKRG